MQPTAADSKCFPLLFSTPCLISSPSHSVFFILCESIPLLVIKLHLNFFYLSFSSIPVDCPLHTVCCVFPLGLSLSLSVSSSLPLIGQFHCQFATHLPFRAYSLKLLDKLKRRVAIALLSPYADIDFTSIVKRNETNALNVRNFKSFDTTQFCANVCNMQKNA